MKSILTPFVPWLVLGGLGSAQGSGSIQIGPDVLVSRDGDVPHIELMLAADPKDASRLLGGAITYTRPGGGNACKAYTSQDGGQTWSDHSFPEQMAAGGADPQVAFSAEGTGLFVALDGSAGLWVYRSENGGRSFGAGTRLAPRGQDHPQLAVDPTDGPFSNRIYIGSLYGDDGFELGVFRSDDDGRTWTGPERFATGGGEKGMNVASLVVLGDGTLCCTYAAWPLDGPEGVNINELWCVRSEDGGDTFSEPIPILTQENPSDPPENLIRLGFPQYAASSASEIYGVATGIDPADRTTRLRFVRSLDGGRTWDPPIDVDGAAEGSHQFQPILAVNHEGTVGVAWYDTRDTGDPLDFHVRFTASVDRGKTFLRSRKLTQARSIALGPGNVSVQPTARRWRGKIRLSMMSAAARWPTGGDYIGMAADGNGDFHPFFADARTGTYQCWTSTIRVLRGAPPAREELTYDLREVTDSIAIVVDPAHTDAATGVMTLPLRLRNIGEETIHPPLAVHVDAFGSGPGTAWRELKPELLNADNGEPHEGAEYDYSFALRDFEALEPGAVTAAIPWKLRRVHATRVPDLHLTVTGAVPER